ncbi:MAG: phasin family protein, partial [Sphingomonadales bacterium]|nr:phasin family protein [Sphingomonadales bacterium]
PAAIAAPAKSAARAAKPVVKAATDAVEATVEPIKKAVETAVSATPKVAPTVEKDVTKMATQFETPKMFTDVSDRAKAMFSKSQSAVADMGEFGKGNVEAMVESGKIAAKGFETLGQDAADYTRRSFESMTAAMKNMASVKSPTELFQLQSEYVRSAFDQAVAQTSKNTEAMIKLASDAAQPLSNRFAVAVEKVKTAA